MIFSSCKKEGPSIFNMFTDVTVEFHSNDPQDIVDYKVVNVGDDVWIDYTVTSAKEDMYTMNLLEVGTSSPTKYALDASQRHVASGVIKLKATARTGPISYRLYPTGKTGIYLGDGYKSITIDVANDYTFTTERYVYIPDFPVGDPVTGVVTYPVVNADAESYFSVTTSETFSYANGPANSAKIDLGIYRNYTSTKISPVPAAAPYYNFTVVDYLYSPSTSPSPVPFNNFDTSSWPIKRGTLFSAGVTTGAATFATFKTGLLLVTAAKKVNINLKTVPAVGGYMYYFLTPEGKYGALLINNNGSDRKHGSYMNMYVKYVF